MARQPLFPGYLFLFVVSGRSLYELRRAPGVRRFVSAGKVPIAVPQRVIDQLRAAEALGQLTDAKPLFSPGQPVRVTWMPDEIARIVRAAPHDRWRVAMQWFGVERELDVAAHQLSPA